MEKGLTATVKSVSLMDLPKNLAAFLLLYILGVSCSRLDEAGHASRKDAVMFLQREGLIKGEEQVVSAEWRRDLSKWLIVVRYPSTNNFSEAFWFINSDATEYSGGTCKH